MFIPKHIIIRREKTVERYEENKNIQNSLGGPKRTSEIIILVFYLKAPNK